MWSDDLNFKLAPVANNVVIAKPQGKHRHVIRDLYDRCMDFNVHADKPDATFMLATMPRAGSTYCAISLWRSGLIGAPMEYLNFSIMGQLFRRLNYSTNDKGHLSDAQLYKYWRDVQFLRTSPNGVFGYKMFMANYNEIADLYPQFLNEIRPNYVIYLTRKDLLGQAISYSRAQLSKAWFGGIKNMPIPEYDYDHIRKCLHSVRFQEDFWLRVFELTEITPIHITYEDLLADNVGTVNSVLVEMGITPDSSSRIDVPLIVRQSDELSDEWRARFLNEASSDIRESLEIRA